MTTFWIWHDNSSLINVLQPAPTRVYLSGFAGAILTVFISPANWTQTLACFRAEGARGEREQHLLAHQFIYVNRRVLEDGDAQIFLLQLDCFRRPVIIRRNIFDIEVAFDGYQDGTQATVAINFGARPDGPAQLNFITLAIDAPAHFGLLNQAHMLLIERQLAWFVNVSEATIISFQLIKFNSHHSPTLFETPNFSMSTQKVLL
jgi:hypothetical protein